MKERPMLFSGPMVRAILEGRKTQTRRVVKVKFVRAVPVPENSVFREGTEWKAECPYAVGQRLWVRETWKPVFESDTGFVGVVFAAGGIPEDDKRAGKYLDGKDRWRPSIHMPYWASRITLEIVSVRVERLQDITEEDAEDEGVTPENGLRWNQVGYTPREAFLRLWDSIYGNWNLNPYVWVVEFRKVEDKR